MNSSMVMSCMVLSLIEDSDERRRSWASERRSTIRPAMHAAMGSDNPAFSKLLRTRVSGVAHADRARRERKRVVSGKRVSVRVDVGWRRIIQTKKYHKKETIKH